MKPYQLNKLAQSLQRTVRYNVIEHYNWAYDAILQGHHFSCENIPRITSEQQRQKLLFLVDQCITPGKIRNNSELMPDLRLYSYSNRRMQHVINFRVPSVSFFEAEFKALEHEFEDVSYSERDRAIFCTVGPYEIQGVNFGKFKVKLSTVVLGKIFPEFRPHITALSPNYSFYDSNMDYPHPHISRGNICLGDGEVPMAKAASEARILDYFTILNSVLSTYGNDPYLAIEAWTGSRCSDCEIFFNPDNGSRCESCEEIYCGSCVGYCCDSTELKLCGSCLGDDGLSCDRCGYIGCTHCIEKCKKCGGHYCEAHIGYHDCFRNF